MSINVVLPGNLNKVERQIIALEAVIPKDTLKDRIIHEKALKRLKEHRKMLLKGEVC